MCRVHALPITIGLSIDIYFTQKKTFFFHCSFLKQDVNAATSDKVFLVQTRAKRLSSLSSFFLFLSALCVLFMGIIGGIEIYRAYVRNQVQRMHFHGFCGVPYDNDINAENQMLTMLNERFRELTENFDNV